MRLFFVVALLLALSMSAQLLIAMPAGELITVNSTGDDSDATSDDGLCATADGVCTLRAAIEHANALGAEGAPHLIHFDLAGSGPHVIAPTAQLPDIAVPVMIDGSTLPGASWGWKWD